MRTFLSVVFLLALVGFVSTPSAIAPEPVRAARISDIDLSPQVFRAVVTAYSSSPDETWGDPFVTASGRPVARGVVACPRAYPFGTRFKIGRRVYTCWDRLHPRYDHRFDIWVDSKDEAVAFGRRRLPVEILGD